MFNYKLRDLATSLQSNLYDEKTLEKPLMGAIFQIDLGNNVGSIQSGRRPCIIFNNFIQDPETTHSLIIPLTKQQKAMHLPTHILIQSSSMNGLSIDSVALVEQLTSIENSKLGKPFGLLTFPEFRQIVIAVKIQLPFLSMISSEVLEKEMVECEKYFCIVMQALKEKHSG